jgi:hypothetical protein
MRDTLVHFKCVRQLGRHLGRHCEQTKEKGLEEFCDTFLVALAVEGAWKSLIDSSWGLEMDMNYILKRFRFGWKAGLDCSLGSNQRTKGNLNGNLEGMGANFGEEH